MFFLLFGNTKPIEPTRNQNPFFFLNFKLLCVEQRAMLWRRRRCCSRLCLTRCSSACSVTNSRRHVVWKTKLDYALLYIKGSRSSPSQPVPTCFIVWEREREKRSTRSIFQHGRFLGIPPPPPVRWSFYFFILVWKRSLYDNVSPLSHSAAAVYSAHI